MDLVQLLDNRMRLIHEPTLAKMQRPSSTTAIDLWPSGTAPSRRSRQQPRRHGRTADGSPVGIDRHHPDHRAVVHNEDAYIDEIIALIFGGTAYDTIAASVQAAVEDKSVKSICLYVNSPGGEIGGCAETAEIIKAAGAVKPVVAYASFLCAVGLLLAGVGGGGDRLQCHGDRRFHRRQSVIVRRHRGHDEGRIQAL